MTGTGRMLDKSNILPFKPKPIEQITEGEFADNFEHIKTDPFYRITSGKFYRIMIKGDEESEQDFDAVNDYILPFIPNEAQLLLLKNLWYRMDIPKARQFGVTTLFSILWLDHALFIPNHLKLKAYL